MKNCYRCGILRVILAVMLLSLWVTAPAGAGETRTVKLEGISFSIPLGFSEPEKAGLGAYSIHTPGDVPGGEENFQVMLVFIDKDMLEAFENDDGEIFNYVKGTFLGAINEPEKKLQRQALGQTVKGELHQQNIPRKASLEAYLIPRKDGTRMVAAFRRFEGMDPQQGEKIIEEFFKTLVEK